MQMDKILSKSQSEEVTKISKEDHEKIWEKSDNSIGNGKKRRPTTNIEKLLQSYLPQNPVKKKFYAFR